MPDQSGQITRLLLAFGEGSRAALDDLLPLVYDDLRRVAHHHLNRERGGHTINTTALVHEAYLALVDTTRVSWRDRAHFFALASRAMRHILIDYARRRNAQKRRGSRIRVPLRDDLATVEPAYVDLLALDEALSRLSEHNDRLAKVVECRFFGGMTAQDTAEALGTSLRTVERDWMRAKAYLFSALSPDPASDGR